jgi:hypothetical protein
LDEFRVIAAVLGNEVVEGRALWHFRVIHPRTAHLVRSPP